MPKNRDSRKKICLVIPSLLVGGMERVMSELAWYFYEKDDIEVHLILYGKEPDIFYKLPENLLIYQPNAQFRDSFRLLYTLKRMMFLRRTVKSIDPDKVISYGEFWNSFVLLSLQGLKYTVFISDRCSPLRPYGTFHSFLRKWLYPKAGGVIAQTHKAKDIYSGQFKHNHIHVIGNPVRQISSANRNIKEENIVLTVGRLIETKHHDSLIRVFSEINMPDWKLIIVGDDALKQNNMDKLKSLVKEFKFEDRIILAGGQSNIDSYYLRSKIFAFMSSSEGFPNVIGEAMSAGLPVIAYDCIAGPSEMITNEKDGVLVPLHDEVQYKQKLEALMSDVLYRERLGSKAKKKIKMYSQESIGNAYYNLLFQNQAGV